MYAARIHDLGCPPTLADIQLETWDVIASRLHGAPLFPRLQHLEITVSLWYASGLLLLLSPSIRFLRVSLERETSLDWSEFVHFLVKSTFGNTLIQSTSRSPPHLQHSEQLWATTPKATAHFRAATVGRFDRLNSISVAHSLPVTGDTLEALSTLPHLRRLEVYTDLQKLNLNLKGGFASLTNCLLRSNKVSDLIQIMSSISLPKVVELHMSVSNAEYNAIHQLLCVVPQAVSADVLTAFAIGIWSPLEEGDPIPSDAPLSLRTVFEPVFELRAVRDLWVRLPPRWLAIDDAGLWALADGWPRLQRVNLGCQTDSSPRNIARRPSLLGVAVMAHRAQELFEIQLPEVDATVMSSPDLIQAIYGAENGEDADESGGRGVDPGGHEAPPDSPSSVSSELVGDTRADPVPEEEETSSESDDESEFYERLSNSLSILHIASLIVDVEKHSPPGEAEDKAGVRRGAMLVEDVAREADVLFPELDADMDLLRWPVCPRWVQAMQLVAQIRSEPLEGEHHHTVSELGPL
ncbi:hypothetical protein C8Q76DRAFT_708670 [Earliella scabrosa]|nr:hypothetical protein C8Q76DRAFT_708670 [Earliella scabrosa]